MKNILIALIFLASTSSLFANTTEKIGTAQCSLLNGVLSIAQNRVVELTKSVTYAKAVVSADGYTCEAIGMVTKSTNDNGVCYSGSLAEPAIGLPSGERIEAAYFEGISSSLHSSKGYHCECIVELVSTVPKCSK